MSLLLNETTSTHSNPTSRFSLILLEPGEIYFEDYLVYYHEFKCPFNETKSTKTTELLEQTVSKKLKGNIKICSKSIVFDPIDLNYPLIKFQFKSIEKIEQFDDDDDDEDIYLTKNPFLMGNKQEDKVKKKCFAISCKQITKCKLNNKIGPYTTVKREHSNDKHYFQFIFTDVNSLDLMKQLHRASTLDYEQEDIMLQLILKSRLSNMGKFDLNHLDDLAREQIQFESIVYKINPLVANPGKIILSNMCLYYKPFNNLDNEKQILKIKLKNIKYVIKRRYHLRKVGCEIIFDDESTPEALETNSSKITNSKLMPYLYLTFEDEIKRDLFYNRLVVDQKEKLINLNNFTQENMLQKWRYGVISNYDYLMYLNNMADRSFNDLTQYPVFPWILQDYTSQTIDLNNPDSFRDLSKPIGALNTERLNRLRQRCKEMSATTTSFTSKDIKNEQPVFLYGSHYSTPAFVSFYLVREYPEWQLCLQNGRFDHANRLFYSIADTWKNCLNIDSDVKELIPEFYDTDSISDSRCNSFLINYQELDLGIRQDNLRVNNVVLPKWCNTPREFIKTMRDALESDYVSENLHKWIDLIFGYKQRGDEALKADNLFYYLCYEGAVNLDSIKNYSERKSLEIQIQEFGQIPSLLFETPHLPKVKKTDLIQNEISLNLSEINLENKSEQTNEISTNLDSIKKQSQYPVINATNFDQIELKFSIKLHKGQINDCLFIDQDLNDEYDLVSKEKYKLPLVCSVSNDNWMKIYSLDDRSLFRSYNVANFSLSSVESIQFNSKIDYNETDTTSDQNRTILLLSCWDNTTYLYDMNYNRCFFSLTNSHDDAVSRVRLFNTKSINSMFILTSSWDSLIKLYHLKSNSKSGLNSNDLFLPNETIKVKLLTELAHDSSVIDFITSKRYLVSLCDDGNAYTWKLNFNKSNDIESELDEGSYYFSYFSSIQNVSDIGKITDCKIIEMVHQDDDSMKKNSNNFYNINTLAICTSYGYVKIFNIETNTELFSLRINLAQNRSTYAKLNKLYYSMDYIITIDSNGYVYFINLQQKSSTNPSGSSQVNGTSSSLSIGFDNDKNCFLTHTISLCSNCLQTLSIYNDFIICVGDSEGYLYFLSIYDI